MKIEGTMLVWSSGRRMFCMTEDEGLPPYPVPLHTEFAQTDLTQEEKVELGTFMGLQWLAYVEKNK